VRAVRRAAFGAVLALLAPGALLLLAPGQASAASYRVAMQGYAFAPASLTVRVGDAVTWTNGDTAPHDVKTTSGPVAIHSPMLNKGQSWTYTFTTAGSYGYYCTVHPDMTARITVLPEPTPTPTPTSHHHETGTSHETMPMPTRTASATRATHRATSAATPSKSPTSAAAAAPSPSPSASVAAAAPQTEPVAAARPLQPLLLLTGVVAGVAVLCLLLVGSRAATARGED
jgi:amicyanin